MLAVATAGAAIPIGDNINHVLNIEEVLTLVEKSEDSTRVDTPPFRPKGGEVYLFIPSGKITKNDWRADGHLWHNNGVKKLPKKEPAFIKSYFILKKIPEDQRTCKCCESNEKEDELHFIVRCPSYNDQRDILTDLVLKGNHFFSSYSDAQKLVWLMSNEDMNTIKIVARFISDSLEVRDHILKQRGHLNE